MASNVVVLYGQRRATIKTTPGKLLSEVRAEACTKFGLEPNSYTLKRNSNTLDLSLSLRLLALPAGAKLDLIKSASSGFVNVILRTVEEPITELADTFPSTTTIWTILRTFESRAHAAGKKNVFLTERAGPSKAFGAGRLVYMMPSVRVDTGRELASFTELRQTLSALGHSGGRVLMKIRFLKTETPYEEALEEIAGFPIEKEEVAPEAEVEASEVKEEVKKEEEMVLEAEMEVSEAKEEVQKAEDVGMVDSRAPENSMSEEASEQNTVGVEIPQATDEQPPSKMQNERPNVTVYCPSASSTPAAAQIEVPEQAYEVGISEARRHQANLSKATRGTRLLSDREMEERETAIRNHNEKIQTIKIRVRFPDSYSCVYSLQGKATASDLYSSIRASLRHPTEPFTLTIPPREQILDSTKRLTTDLRIGSSATVQFAWTKEASNKVRKEKCLNDDMLLLQQALPEAKIPEVEMDEEEEKEERKGAGKGGRGKGGGSAKGKESVLKSFLRLGKK